MIRNILLFLHLSFFTVFTALSQDINTHFQKEIQAFQQQDSINFPPTNGILLIGSSSFTYWKDVQLRFPDYPIINRGFGGSTLLDVIHYADQVIYPYKPKQILIYCGENDLAKSDTITSKLVFSRFKTLYQNIRTHLGSDTHITYISIKPSPSRQHLIPKMKKTNQLIRKFLQKQTNTTFINVYDAMLDANGFPQTDIFIKDKLHMNAKGYDIWVQIIKPYLLK